MFTEKKYLTLFDNGLPYNKGTPLVPTSSIFDRSYTYGRSGTMFLAEAMNIGIVPGPDPQVIRGQHDSLFLGNSKPLITSFPGVAIETEQIVFYPFESEEDEEYEEHEISRMKDEYDDNTEYFEEESYNYYEYNDDDWDLTWYLARKDYFLFWSEFNGLFTYSVELPYTSH